MEIQYSAYQQFVEVSSELLSQFPELDLRFCYEEGSNCLRCAFSDPKAPALEMTLELDNSIDIIQEASFQIKLLFQRFDA